MHEEVRERIREKMGGMSPSFHQIALFILDNFDNVGFISVNELSHMMKVSNASLVRFTQSLGFKGYKEFREIIQQEVKTKLNTEHLVALNKLDVLPAQEQLEQLFENEINNLRTTFKNIQVQTLTEIVKEIYAARKVFISGFGMSRNIVRLFSYALVSMEQTQVIELSGSVSDYNPNLHMMENNDCLFLMTLPPYSPEGLQVADYAKRKGVHVCLFTDSPACPTYAIADEVVLCENNSLLLSNSYVGLVAVVQILINMLLLNGESKKIENMREVWNDEKKGYQFLKDHKVQ